jgi:hypothetical protein
MLSKKKERPRKTWRLVKFLGFIVGFLGCSVVLFILSGLILAAWGDYNTQHYSEKMTENICEKLLFPVDSNFCQSNNNNFDTLEEALTIIYDPKYSTHDTLTFLFSNKENVNAYYCKVENERLYNTCPKNRCNGEYVCDIKIRLNLIKIIM